jgi:hypothetical protein
MLLAISHMVTSADVAKHHFTTANATVKIVLTTKYIGSHGEFGTIR